MNKIHQEQESLRISVQEILFYGYFATMLVIKGLGYADGPVYKCGLFLAFFLALEKIVLTSYTKVEWLILIASLGMAGINMAAWAACPALCGGL